MDSHETWVHAVGGGGKSKRSPPSGEKSMKMKSKNFWGQLIHPYGGGAFFAMCRPFCSFFLLMGALFRYVGLFRYFFHFIIGLCRVYA